jgi:hypothetical protein
MASDEHLVSPFGKWKLCGFVGGGEKLFSRTLLVTVIHQQDANGNIRLLLDCFQRGEQVRQRSFFVVARESRARATGFLGEYLPCLDFPLRFDKRKAEWDWNADFEWSIRIERRVIRYFERS